MADKTFKSECPFCATDSRWIAPDGAGGYSVECECGANGPAGETVQDAINMWETRSTKERGE